MLYTLNILQYYQLYLNKAEKKSQKRKQKNKYMNICLILLVIKNANKYKIFFHLERKVKEVRIARQDIWAHLDPIEAMPT